MKKLMITFCLIFLIIITAVIKTSSKKIEEKIFILNENLFLLQEKYNLVSFEHTYLSEPSRLIKIMKTDKNEEYFHLENKNLKILFENETELLNKSLFKND
tara:strand:- start:96 stop:398 length:303 start_codon:yes stop_codon:yes gene_type:complete